MSLNKYQYKFDEFLILPNGKSLFRGDKFIPLSGRAFDVLLLLIQGEGKLVLKQELLDKVWFNVYVEEGNLAVAINALRKALHTDEKKVYIETFPKRGYRFNAQVEKEIIDDSSEKEIKQPFSLSVSELPIIMESPVVSLPKSAQRKPFLSFLPKMIQRKWLLFILTLCFLSYGFTTITFQGKTEAHPIRKVKFNSQKLKIAVFPFVDLKPSLETEHLRLSFADSIMYELSQSDEFSIIPSTLADKSFQKVPSYEEIKRETDADLVLLSAFIKDDEKIEVVSRLIEVKTGEVIMTAKENLSNFQFTVSRKQFTKNLASRIKLDSNLIFAASYQH